MLNMLYSAAHARSGKPPQHIRQASGGEG